MGERASGDAVEQAIAELTALVADQQRRLDEQAERIAELSSALDRSPGAMPQPEGDASDSAAQAVDRRVLLRTATAAATGALIAGASTALRPVAAASAAERTEASDAYAQRPWSSSDTIGSGGATASEPLTRSIVDEETWEALRVETEHGSPFSLLISHTADFLDVADPVAYFGWNVGDQGGRIDGSKPAAFLQLEADYYADMLGALQHFPEAHVILNSGTYSARVFSSAMGSVNGHTSTGMRGDEWYIADRDYAATPETVSHRIIYYDRYGDDDVVIQRELHVRTKDGGIVIDGHAADPAGGTSRLVIRRPDTENGAAEVNWVAGAGTDEWKLCTIGGPTLYLRGMESDGGRTIVAFGQGAAGDASTEFADQLKVRRGSADQVAALFSALDENGNRLFAIDAATGMLRLGAAGVSLRVGVGEPEASVAAAVGSLFLRTDGREGATLYVKEAGDDDTGWVAAGATAAGGFVPLTRPTRVYDSRPGYEPTVGEQSVLRADTPRAIDLTANASGVPTWASAVMVSLVATQTVSSSRGWLAIYANGLEFPGTSSVNWSASGRSAATTTVTAIDAEGRCALYAGSDCDVVVDVIGYFR